LISPKFHEPLELLFFCQKKKLQSQTVTRETPCKTLLYDKGAHKMLGKIKNDSWGRGIRTFPGIGY